MFKNPKEFVLHSVLSIRNGVARRKGNRMRRPDARLTLTRRWPDVAVTLT